MIVLCSLLKKTEISLLTKPSEADFILSHIRISWQLDEVLVEGITKDMLRPMMPFPNIVACPTP